MTALLSVKDLGKVYKTKRGLLSAVEQVSFDIGPGETVALVGESGCGKSTIAMSLPGLVEASTGKVVFDGANLVETRGKQLRDLRRQIGVVFQNPYSSLDPKMKIRDIIAEPLKAATRLRGSGLKEKIVACLEDVGLGAQHLDNYPHQFSGGQRQRIAIARALALEPKLLILDEPTSALDVSVQAQVLNLLKRLQQQHGISYLFISHNLATVEYIADRILVMYLGRIVESGPTAQVFSTPMHPYTRALIDSVPTTDLARRGQFAPLAGEIPSPINRPPGCAFAPRCPRTLDQCRQQVPLLLMPGTTNRAVACFNRLERAPDGAIAT